MSAHNIIMQFIKVYVGMSLYVDPDGNMKPIALEWTNGARYRISKVLDKRTAPPANVGGILTERYAVIIQGQEKVLYYEKANNRWFVEKQI